ncbi:hypothetical protein HELRODRAFT_181287 [Helobdella robusta]|uniref:Uncharacterized protein n=1 Tax=Helobdella robusta TaxID=6412 RepID=T1FGU6_HELRO|nr:hypothetical protein HELRODRAFT_181287 [Helobdella robusta]ESN93174.1 hypothetical protein HELRODRAFT_181287 [Helobdella robusta]
MSNIIEIKLAKIYEAHVCIIYGKDFSKTAFVTVTGQGIYPRIIWCNVDDHRIPQTNNCDACSLERNVNSFGDGKPCTNNLYNGDPSHKDNPLAADSCICFGYKSIQFDSTPVGKMSTKNIYLANTSKLSFSSRF